MTINLTVPMSSGERELKPRITVIGVGGAGGNAVNNMIQSGLEGVDFIVANSDAQALQLSKSERRIQMGTEVTQGLGAGSNPDIGRAAAEESLEEIIANLREANMVFITAGLGGGTGTGAAPVIAQAARDYGILTVGVVTKPFQFEGAKRMRLAEAGLDELQKYVDTLLIIPNQNLFRVANEKTTFADAFKMADDVLYSGVRGVTDLMVMPGLINLDFADIKSVMSEMGKAMMGTGEAEGERRATEAAEQAIANPLLDDMSMSGANGVLINITAGHDITLFEVDEAANRIRDEVEADANIIFGSTFDESLEGKIRVSVVATGIEAATGVRPEPVLRQVTGAPENPRFLPAINAEPVAKEKPAPVEMIPRPEPVLAETMPAKTAAAEANTTEPGTSVSSVIEDIRTELGANLASEPSAGEPLTLVPEKPEAEVFIPAPPANGAVHTDTGPAPDPFAVADMVNAGMEPEPPAPSEKSGPSLFARVTGVARGDKKRRAIEQEQQTPAETVTVVPEPAPETIPDAVPETPVEEVVAEAPAPLAETAAIELAPQPQPVAEVTSETPVIT
ncbi:MAG: cell division protein FtsZ, partial [Rhodospirillales bacterium]|nr:cell division protein FtsZ [Rhodospirillales bacterium]